MEITLIKKNLQAVRHRQRLKQLTAKLLLGAVFALAGMMIVLSSVSLALVRANKQLDQKISAVKQKIGSLEDVESKQVYLISKLSSFKALVNQQQRHQAVAETVFSLIPDRTSLKGFDVNETGALKLSGSVPDWPSLTTLINRIRNLKTERLTVVKAEVSKISFSSDGEVNFEVNLQLSGGKTAQ